MVKSLRKNHKSSFGKKKMTGGSAMNSTATVSQKKLVRLFTDPADKKGTGDVDDFIGIQVLCYYASVANFDIEIIISGLDSEERKTEFMQTDFFTLLDKKEKYSLRGKVKSLEDFESLIPEPRVQELNIWNAGVGEKTIIYFQSLDNETQTYSIQGNGFNDFNIVETLRIIFDHQEILTGYFHQKKKITSEHYEQLVDKNLTLFYNQFEIDGDGYIEKDSPFSKPEITGNSSTDTQKKSPIINLPRLYKNINQEQLVVKLTMKLFGQSICLAGAPLCFWKGFFAFSDDKFTEFMEENKGNPKIKNVCERIYGKNNDDDIDLGIGGGKGNNIKAFIKAVAQLEDAQISDLMATNVNVSKYNVQRLFTEPLYKMNDIEKSLRFEDTDNGTSMGQAFEVVGQNYPAAIKGFEFIIRCFIYMFGDTVTQSCFPQVEGKIVGTYIFTFGSECVSKIKEAIEEKSDTFVFQKLPTFYNNFGKNPSADGKKRLLALCLEETPPLWDGVNTLWSINKAFFPEKNKNTISQDETPSQDEEKLTNSFNEAFKYVSDITLREESIPKKVKRGHSHSGGKRTNKKLRKNKKHSLRKMKGGSKKANQKKLKLRKSRKA